MEAFGEWLLDQKDRDDPIGDLARDFTEVPSHPMTLKSRGITVKPRKEVSTTDIIVELNNHPACRAAKEAAEVAIAEYMVFG